MKHDCICTECLRRKNDPIIKKFKVLFLDCLTLGGFVNEPDDRGEEAIQELDNLLWENGKLIEKIAINELELDPNNRALLKLLDYLNSWNYVAKRW